MAAIVNDLDVFLQTVSPRVNPVTFGSGDTFDGDVDYGNVTGTKPPANATQNIFTSGTASPSGGANGDSYWETDQEIMWHNVAGVWEPGGTVNASSIITGTLGAARIAANSITSDKLNVGTLSAISANLGTVTAGSITGTSTIDISGQARFRGNTASIALSANDTIAATTGIFTSAPTAGTGLWSRVGAATAIKGQADSASGTGVRAQNQFGGTALHVNGKMTIDNTTKVTNLNADLLDGLSSGSFLGVSATAANSNSLGGVASSSWARIFPTDSGTANASGAGCNFLSTISGVGSLGSGNTVTYRSVSDRELKMNIVDSELGLAHVNQLRPRTFRMRDNPKLIHHGLIAQEVAETVNDDRFDLAHTHEDGLMGVSHNGYVTILIKAVQELSKGLDESNAKIAQLEVLIAEITNAS